MRAVGCAEVYAGPLLGVGKRELSEVPGHQLRHEVGTARAPPADDVVFGYEDASVAGLATADSALQAVELFVGHRMGAPKVKRARKYGKPSAPW
jgi:hypothetical protein